MSDPVIAYEHAKLLKRAIKRNARNYGFNATLMAKSFSYKTRNRDARPPEPLQFRRNQSFFNGRGKLK